MRNLVKTLKTLFIISFSMVVAACSSGGTGSTEGVNISGTFFGILQESTSFAYDVQFDFAQFDTVGIPGNPQSSTVTFSITVIRLNSAAGEVPDVCTGATLAGGTLTISAAANPATLVGDGFNAVVIDNTIVGQSVFDEFEPITVINADGEEDDVDCVFGGPINLSR